MHLEKGRKTDKRKREKMLCTSNDRLLSKSGDALHPIMKAGRARSPRGLGPLGRTAQVLSLLAQRTSRPTSRAGLHRLLAGLLLLDTSRKWDSRRRNSSRSRGCHDRNMVSRTSRTNSGGGGGRSVLGLTISRPRKRASGADGRSRSRSSRRSRRRRRWWIGNRGS
jgi:hypothetical protein